MIEKEPNQISTDIPHRRRGNAFDTLANVFRNVKELVFRNGLVMRNRPSEIADSKNVFEMYAENDAGSGENYIFIGRNGVVTRTDTRNMSYIELTANADTTKTGLNTKNGVILIQLSKSKVVDTWAQISMVNGDVLQANGTGTRTNVNGEGDATSNDIGGVQVAYRNNTTGVIQAIVIDKDGIQMYGLPTSATGLSTGTIWNSSGTLRIVT